MFFFNCYSNYDHKRDYPVNRDHDDVGRHTDVPILKRMDQRQKRRPQARGDQHR